MANDYAVNLEDERLQQVDDKYQEQVEDVTETYTGLIGGAENIYQPQIDALDEWGNKQIQLQNDRTNQTIQQIEQQKQQAQKDYQKEQSASYVDWRKQSNEYGTEAEKMASSGLMGTGFSESSQVSMYNTYQNRVAQARESYDRVIMNYNNSITEAKLQNNSVLAEIAWNTLSKQLELITEGTMYKNDLILQLADKKLQLQQMRDSNWFNMLDQINTENALAEDARQFQENLEFQSEQSRLDREFEAAQAELDRQFKEDQAAIDRQHEKDMLAAKTKAEKELADHNHKLALEELAKKHQNDLALLQKQWNLEHQGTTFGTTTSRQQSYYNRHDDIALSNPANGEFAKYEVNTAYYKGSKNPDGKKYGTFSNGYQPKGISGHGSLKKTGENITLETKTLSGQKQTLVQNVWKAEDGTKWYWEGRQNKYIQIK